MPRRHFAVNALCGTSHRSSAVRCAVAVNVGNATTIERCALCTILDTDLEEESDGERVEHEVEGAVGRAEQERRRRD